MSTLAGEEFYSQLREQGFALKPSFYIMRVSLLTALSTPAKQITGKLDSAISDANREIKAGDDSPPDHSYAVTDVENIDDEVLEIRLRWQCPVRYWNPSKIRPEFVDSLKIGFVLLHKKASKALVACHTISERSHISKIVARALGIHFHDLSLTKELLEQIGTFDTVRRASYFFRDDRPDRAKSITYADELLGSIPVVRSHEENSYADRKLSFYRIPLVGMGERGVGATSDSAKLWIPSDTPPETVRAFGIALLKRITGTLKKMKASGDLDGVLDVVWTESNPLLAGVKPITLRRDVYLLIRQIIKMLVVGDAEHVFHPSSALLTAGAPEYFEYGRLPLFNEETQTSFYWRRPDDGAEQLRFSVEGGKWRATSVPSGAEVDLNHLTHSDHEKSWSVPDPTGSVHMFPTVKLHRLVLAAIESLAEEIPKLKSVVSAPFTFGSGVIRFDLKRARSSPMGSAANVIAVEDIPQLSRAHQRALSPQKRKDHLAVLNRLGEKCANMSDSNCQSCLSDLQYLCLRSLTARYMTRHLLLQHKNIELCDLEGEFKYDGGRITTFVFSKLNKGKSGLTLRNPNGAVLLGQIIQHIEKSAFNVIGVLSSSTINEDLRERLTFLAGLLGKSVVFFDDPILCRMLAEFEEQAVFENLDLKTVYRVSATKGASLKDGQTLPGQLIAPV